MRAFFENSASGANGIFYAAQTGDRTSAESGSVHDDGVAFDMAIEIEVRAEASVKDGIVFENHDGGFDGVQSATPFGEYTPACLQGAEAASVAGIDSIVGNIPGTAMNDERGLHGRYDSRYPRSAIGKHGRGANPRHVFHRTEKCLLETAAAANGLDKEVQEEEEHTEEKKEGAPREAALRKLRDGVQDRGRNDAKTRSPSRFIKRTRGDIAGKISAQEREFVFHPERKLFAIAPKIDGPDDENKVPEKGKKAESRS